MEYVTDMFRFDVHLDGALRLVDYNLRGIAIGNHGLEFGIGGGLSHATVGRTSTGEVE
jgi:hypothetical protein